MATTVIGTGRSGTNMTLEILRGNSFFQASKDPENKFLFQKPQIYSNDYLTKCDTYYCSSTNEIDKLIQYNPNIKIIWTIRDPRDIILSKIRRGQPRNKGGDCKKLSDDGTPKGCIKNMEHMFSCYQHIKKYYPSKMMLVKMEDIINSLENTTKKMCYFIEIDYEPLMCDFADRIRVQVKKDRYKQLDKNQVEIWRNWQTSYNGFFVENNYQIDTLFNQIQYLIDYFNYK